MSSQLSCLAFDLSSLTPVICWRAQKVGYEDKLESTSTNWTVLAPRDWALEGFQKDHGDLLSDTNKLRDLIKYHILTRCSRGHGARMA